MINNVVDKHVEDLDDIIFHLKKNRIELNIFQMNFAFYEQHKMEHGSYKEFEGQKYNELMKKRYDWVKERIWDVIECKIKHDKYGGI